MFQHFWDDGNSILDHGVSRAEILHHGLSRIVYHGVSQVEVLHHGVSRVEILHDRFPANRSCRDLVKFLRGYRNRQIGRKSEWMASGTSKSSFSSQGQASGQETSAAQGHT